MIQRPSDRVLNSLANLETNTDFQQFLQYLKEVRQDLWVQGSESKDDVLCRWSGGAAQAVDSLIKSAETARSIIQKRR